MRSRQKNPVNSYFKYNTTVYPAVNYLETMVESALPGPCSVVHTKHIKPWSFRGYNSGDPNQLYEWFMIPGYYPPVPMPTKFNWSKIPSSTEFGILQFIAELDDTLASFSLKALKKFSYGSFTWGVLPLVSDLQAILKAVANLSKNLKSFQYADQSTETFSFNNVLPYDRFYGQMTCNYRMNGVAGLDVAAQRAEILLDRLGFHPDLATAWDLVPFSFVVDYLFPVGDFLDSLYGGGWVRSVNFDGWQSCKWTVEGTWESLTLGPSFTAKYSVAGYQRFPISRPLTIAPSPKWNALEQISFKKIFNTLYLGGFNEEFVSKTLKGL